MGRTITRSARKPGKKARQAALQKLKDADAAVLRSGDGAQANPDEEKAALGLYESGLVVLREEVEAGQRPQHELELFSNRCVEVEGKIMELRAKQQARAKSEPEPEPEPEPIGTRTKKPSKKDLRLALQGIKDAHAAADHKAALDLYENSLAVLRSEVAAGQRPQNELEMFATRISEVERKIQERTAKLQRRGKARRRSAGEVSNS